MQKRKKKEVFSRQEQEVLWEFQDRPLFLQRYQALDGEWKRRFLEFCLGKRTLPLTYDPFFKKIFHPDMHPGRLSRLLSSLLDRKVAVVRILPTEEMALIQDALMVMEILVELEDGSLANVEVQKVPYLFPAERMSCYSADLLLRQYSRVKGERGKKFKYDDVRKVYTIVFYEKSVGTFHRNDGSYIHMGKTTFDTGLELELLQEYCLIALDVFRKIPYTERNRDERTGWLSLLATESVEEALRLAEEYPWLVEVYQEIIEYMKKPEEVLDMFSEALRILDRNTVQYMIEEQEEQLKEQKEQIERQKKELKANQRKLKTSQKELEESRKEAEALREELARLKSSEKK